MTSILKLSGKCSSFGGISDRGVGQQEGLALVNTVAEAQAQPFAGLFNSVAEWFPNLGLARNLNPNAMYCAMRWNYSVTSAWRLRFSIVRVQSSTGMVAWCRPVDWGPNEDTGRVIDLSPGAMAYLGVATDDTVLVEVCE